VGERETARETNASHEHGVLSESEDSSGMWRAARGQLG